MRHNKDAGNHYVFNVTGNHFDFANDLFRELTTPNTFVST